VADGIFSSLILVFKNKNMFVIKLSYTKPLEAMDKARPKHLEFLDKYYAKNIFLASGRQTPPIGGVIIAISNDKEEIEKIIKEDPFYIEKLAEYEIIQFTPVKFHPAIKDLI
jgi:uncharacterized protein YciI